jgi:hypothetical protein
VRALGEGRDRGTSQVCKVGEGSVKTISKAPLMRENNLPQVTEHFTAAGRRLSESTARKSAVTITRNHF